jgi:hypothetical protein
MVSEIGFNWDITGDKTIQVRGGTGILLESFLSFG